MQETPENNNLPEFSVSELSTSIKLVVEGAFEYVKVRGEISGYKRAPSGHVYLNLKDENAVLAAVCWKGTAMRFAFKPEDGMEVVCSGRITTYAGQSKYQMIIESMKPAGVGALMELLEKRKKQLADEGLFDAARKKPIPFLPDIVGVITSPTGAVIQDILHRLEDRFPVHVMLWPVLVQGDKAAGQITDAINGFNSRDKKPDVIIVARGGGSLEDLWPFNEENVVRAVANSKIPVISAVGHETDTMLIDYAADLRAPTPSAAAEMVVPVRGELILLVDDLARRGKAAVMRVLEEKKNILEGLARGLPKPQFIIDEYTQKLDSLIMRMHNAYPNLMQMKGQKLEFLEKLLNSYHYKKVLERGYAIVRDGKKVVASSAAVIDGKKLKLEFHDGEKEVVATGTKVPGKKKVGNEGQGDLF